MFMSLLASCAVDLFIGCIIFIFRNRIRNVLARFVSMACYNALRYREEEIQSEYNSNCHGCCGCESDEIH